MNKMCLWYMFMIGHWDAVGYFSPNQKKITNSYFIYCFHVHQVFFENTQLLVVLPVMTK